MKRSHIVILIFAILAFVVLIALWLMKPMPPITKIAPYPSPGPVITPTKEPLPLSTPTPEFVYRAASPPQIKKKTIRARLQAAAGFTCASAQSHVHNDIVEVAMDISTWNGCVMTGIVNGASLSVFGGTAPSDIRLPQIATVKYDRTCGQVSYWKVPGGIATLPQARRPLARAGAAVEDAGWVVPEPMVLSGRSYARVYANGLLNIPSREPCRIVQGKAVGGCYSVPPGLYVELTLADDPVTPCNADIIISLPTNIPCMRTWAAPYNVGNRWVIGKCSGAAADGCGEQITSDRNSASTR